MIRDSIQIVWSLLDSPLVWFALLVLSLTAAGVLYVLVGRPTRIEPAPECEWCGPVCHWSCGTDIAQRQRAERFHNSNQFGV